MSRFSPTVRHRRLLQELRRLRSNAELKQEDVAEHLGWSPSRMTKVEGGSLRISVSDVRAMLQLYGVEQATEEHDVLVQLARQSREKGWWHTYSDVIPHWFQVYVGLEAEALSLRNYESELIHGLLQTEDYARTVYRAAQVTDSPDEIERYVALRMARQEIVTKNEDPLRFWTVLNEAALRRPVGGEDVMRAQLHRLADMASLANVTLQVLPYSAGAHAAMLGPFALLAFSDQGGDDVAYLEHATGSFYLEKPEDVRRYKSIFDHLSRSALDPDDSLVLINRMVHAIL
ncbi:transcriptional regulator [Sphaerisporangium rufum]|uniref:Transcriptional regulator n=1 Tax=Sphaerisporangium rufum TaxID=1381558 RepID=A0A919QYB6_9ACTN|nr:helix-turn-helix transcriptional regulator [Sphaerisporangium rufum]GII76356.1 transcriptional regulator [Sphaerisporangium rufum]